jgi:hypothetical protein
MITTTDNQPGDGGEEIPTPIQAQPITIPIVPADDLEQLSEGIENDIEK